MRGGGYYLCRVSERLKEIAEKAAAGAAPEEVVAELEALHQEISEDVEARAAFEREVPSLADGLYIPHLFWMYLAAYQQDPESYRPFLEYLLHIYAQHPPSPFVEKRLRPLLYVYFSAESPFYLNRLWDYFRRHARPEKYEILENVRNFIEKNPSTVDIFKRKFSLLADYMPDFDLLFLPISQIQATLGEGTANASSE